MGDTDAESPKFYESFLRDPFQLLEPIPRHIPVGIPAAPPVGDSVTGMITTFVPRLFKPSAPALNTGDPIARDIAVSWLPTSWPSDPFVTTAQPYLINIAPWETRPTVAGPLEFLSDAGNNTVVPGKAGSAISTIPNGRRAVNSRWIIPSPTASFSGLLRKRDSVAPGASLVYSFDAGEGCLP
jgi:hypothetical protein